MVEPSLNVTVPVKVPEPVKVTVAENVTDCPNTEGVPEEIKKSWSELMCCSEEQLRYRRQKPNPFYRHH